MEDNLVILYGSAELSTARTCDKEGVDAEPVKAVVCTEASGKVSVPPNLVLVELRLISPTPVAFKLRSAPTAVKSICPANSSSPEPLG